MTEDATAAPGWADARIDAAFAPLPATPEVAAARTAYAECLAARNSAAAPSDLLGAEFEPCDAALRRALMEAGIDRGITAQLLSDLESIEAEIAGES